MSEKSKEKKSRSVDTAVILAAGMGMRLRNTIGDHPKGFVCLGSLPIIEESLRRLYHAGIKRVIIVTGYQHAFYEKLRTRYVGLETVHNAEYAVSGSLYSLFCARNLIEDDFLLLESDLVYEPRAIEELQRIETTDVILLSGLTGAGDEVFVETVNNNLFAMSKDINHLDHIDGELVGISRISHDFFLEMMATAERRFTETLYLDYETDGFVATARQKDMLCFKIEDLIWCEIDDQAHLRRARETIYPRLLREIAGQLNKDDQTE